jgi:hypothetical protein
VPARVGAGSAPARRIGGTGEDDGRATTGPLGPGRRIGAATTVRFPLWMSGRRDDPSGTSRAPRRRMGSARAAPGAASVLIGTAAVPGARGLLHSRRHCV